ncbi:hypothetical protein ACO0LB_09260 [Undibacterium sp. SXout7W]|uniref:hypothetical protein n=1 Tax=Undibacterium sp. SXout7W TaxID=3413049 RepID=UPI003BF0CE36
MFANFNSSLLKKSTVLPAQDLAVRHVVVAAIFGGSIFVAVALAFAGVIDFSFFISIAIALLSVQIIVCWALSLIFKGIQLRFLGVLLLLVVAAIFNLGFHFSPLLQPPRFLS